MFRDLFGGENPFGAESRPMGSMGNMGGGGMPPGVFTFSTSSSSSNPLSGVGGGLNGFPGGIFSGGMPGATSSRFSGMKRAHPSSAQSPNLIPDGTRVIVQNIKNARNEYLNGTEATIEDY